ncbi:MAG: helix-turn-helix domain-containing protein [Candidatus Nezhaarchaeota archaeon]|nr:helix-turn-helix domain-containing protein [Candidatus Nezhaarchaeota archaeon]
MSLTAELIEEAKKLRGEGLNYAEIARRLGVPRTTLYYSMNPERRRVHAARWRAKVRGVEAPVKARRYRRVTQEDVRAILELSERGESIPSIAKSLGRSTSLVYYILKKHGRS